MPEASATGRPYLKKRHPQLAVFAALHIWRWSHGLLSWERKDFAGRSGSLLVSWERGDAGGDAGGDASVSDGVVNDIFFSKIDC